MLLRIFATVALAGAVAAPGVHAQQGGADDPARVLAAASERFSGIRGVCADFVQEMKIPLLNEEKSSRGRLCQMRPNLFRMDFTDPDGDQVVADGDHFWLYYRSMNPDQVIRLPVDPSRGGLDFYREFLENPTEKYDMEAMGRESVDGMSTVRVHLTPRSDRGYQDATVWIDPASRLIRRIEVREENGSVRRVTLNHVKVDPGLSADDFTFTPPAGVHVVSG